MAVAGRSRMTLKSLSPRAWLEACNRTVQQPQRTRRHPRTKFGVDVPCAAGCCEWAEPAPDYGPFPHQTIAQGSSPVVAKVGVAWEWEKDEEWRAVTPENSETREWPARPLSLRAPHTTLQLTAEGSRPVPKRHHDDRIEASVGEQTKEQAAPNRRCDAASGTAWLASFKQLLPLHGSTWDHARRSKSHWRTA
ncbi:hypothetical protein K458DRAFT_390312 [Lentithecium fluviatile CBS 122367]|uniref:Uncharacterized protein n=1 Tax=Lentithecium fluviatile CBS 122367 TaxID=1168545 RepID=A0A6G1IXR4_9PLEO|nr:hypothetical protein K458DRAFT_390312 [Lentithecium fluviatile CBS 122367]